MEVVRVRVGFRVSLIVLVGVVKGHREVYFVVQEMLFFWAKTMMLALEGEAKNCGCMLTCWVGEVGKVE